MQEQINYLKRIAMSFTDIQYSIKYLDKTIKETDKLILRALHEAIIISYTRPFSAYDKRYHKIKSLNKKFIHTFNSTEKELHDNILKLRNSIIAHSDGKSYDVNLNIFKLDKELNSLHSIQRNIPTILSNKEMEILRNCCEKIINYLITEQIKIKNTVDIGNY